jgi:hypothetical protein
MIACADPVGVLCELIEAGDGSLDATALRERSNAEIEFLSNIGAVTAAELSSVVTCRACDNDHIARLEFDPSTRRHRHFCPEAGYVTVEDAALATLRAEPQWLVNWLVTALPITTPVRRRVLVPASAWHLGDAYVGRAELTVVFAIGVGTQRNLDALALAVSTVPPATFGVVLTTSGTPPRRLMLPHGYEILELREIALAEQNCLAINKTKLAGWIKGYRKGLDKPAQLRAGRPSDVILIHEIFRERRAKALPWVNQATEAEKIRAEIALRHPDRDPPAVKTIERHLSRISKAKSGGLSGAERSAN